MSPRNSEGFDGYRKWLGISHQKRPPNHYELLSIALDEDDDEVIQAAAEQRRQYVESKRGQGHDAIVTEILYRIDEAEITLLNVELRREYDRRLHLFEKRRKNRQIDTVTPGARVKSRRGRTVGEDPQIVKMFAGIMAVICVGFGVMAWFSFQLPWGTDIRQTKTIPFKDDSVPAEKIKVAETPPLDPDEIRLGKWVDLLEKVYIPRHSTKGKWVKDAEGLIAKENHAFTAIEIPAALSDSYDLELRVTRIKGNDLKFSVPVCDSRVRLDLEPKWLEFSNVENEEKRLSVPLREGRAPLYSNGIVVGRYQDKWHGLGFERFVDGSELDIPHGRPHTIRMRITREGAECQVQLKIEDKQILHWKGPHSDLHETGADDFWDGTKRSGIVFGTGPNSSAVFHTMRLRGKGAEEIRW